MSLRDRRPTIIRTAEALVTETLTAAQISPQPSPATVHAVHGSQKPAPPRTARRTTPRSSSSPERVIRHVVLLTAEQTAWMRGVRLDALRDDDRELPMSAIVRVAVDELVRRGGWHELRDSFIAHADTGPRRGRHLPAPLGATRPPAR